MAVYVNSVLAMVLKLDGNSEIGAHVRNNVCYYLCLWHLIKSRAVTNRFFFAPKRHIFPHASATCSELPSNISTLVLTVHATITSTLLFLYFIYNN